MPSILSSNFEPVLRLARRATAILSRFARARSGVAAVEFALLLPFMFMLYIGLVETTQYVTADRKAIIFSRTLADLTSQPTNIDLVTGSPTNGQPVLTDTNRDNIFAFATATLFPFAATNAAMRITQFAIDNNGGAPRAFVDWQETCTWQATSTCTYGASGLFAAPTARCAIDGSVDADLLTANTYLIRGEVSYHYAPILTALFATTEGGSDGYLNFLPSGGFQLYTRVFARPRSNVPIIRVYTDGSSTLKKADKVTANDAPTVCPGFKP